MITNIPNLLSFFRILAAPLLLLVSWFGMHNIFYILLGLMLISDALDGMIARRLHQTTQRGAKLDSVGDILMYFAIALSVWWLWPELVKEEMYYVIAAIILYSLPALFALLKFGSLASYHTWLTKFTAVLMSAGMVLLLGFDNNLLFHSAVYVLLIAMVENILITMILPKQKNNIYSIWHALKEKDSSMTDKGV
jgi:CDP-diacylglycerol--glycerol-3-phosphate 3-phosphatidyltransferase